MKRLNTTYVHGFVSTNVDVEKIAIALKDAKVLGAVEVDDTVAALLE